MNKNNEQNLFFKKILEDGPITNIQMKDKQFILEIVESGEKGAPTAIEAGNIQTILDNLKHEPAEAIELEAAIANIEDQLMPIIRDLPKRRCLVTSEEMFWSIAKVAGLTTNDNLQLDIATVGEIFNRLTDVAYGTPARMLKIPENREFAATLLFLRELMHHAGFNTIFFTK